MLALVAGLLMKSSIAQMSRPALLQNVSRIVMLGDSITELGGLPNGYVTLVTASLNEAFGKGAIEVVNAGISGQKAPDMQRRFQSDVLARHPQLVTISVGVNDVWHNFRNGEWTARVASGDSGFGVNLPDYIAKVEEMVSSAKNGSVQVVLLSPTLVYEDLSCSENVRLTEYCNAERKIASKYHVPFVDLNRAFREAVGDYQKFAGKRSLLLTVDGVHMNDAGNGLMAHQLLKTLGLESPDRVSPH
jgi:lysophospholipase L1-like esterase